MEVKREEFFQKCKDDVTRLLNMIQEAGDVYVSDGIVGVVKLNERSYPVYQYNVGKKELKVSKKLHEYLVSNGALEREEAHEAQ